MSKAWAGFCLGLVLGAALCIPTTAYICGEVYELGWPMFSPGILLLPIILAFILIVWLVVWSSCVLSD